MIRDETHMILFDCLVMVQGSGMNQVACTGSVVSDR